MTFRMNLGSERDGDSETRFEVFNELGFRCLDTKKKLKRASRREERYARARGERKTRVRHVMPSQFRLKVHNNVNCRCTSVIFEPKIQRCFAIPIQTIDQRGNNIGSRLSNMNVASLQCLTPCENERDDSNDRR